MLLQGHANDFLFANMLTKLHNNDLFGWASSPTKTYLVLILMVKPYFSWSQNYSFENILPSYVLVGNVVILRALYHLVNEKKPVKIFFFLLFYIASYSRISFGLHGRSYFIFMHLLELYHKLLEKPSK